MAEELRKISAIFTSADGRPDIVFTKNEQNSVAHLATTHASFLRRYTKQSFSKIFRAMGCQTPLHQSMSDWIFSFLCRCPAPLANQVLGTTKDIFSEPQCYKRNYIILTKLQFHRLVAAALQIHQFRKIRYQVDFRLALDFIEERRFFIILLSGAPGTGKSTIASLIASKLSVTHIISTDSIRHAMRTMYPKDKFPIIHCSTYECGEIVDPDHKLSDADRCVQGYLEQSDMVGQELIKVIRSFVASKASLIVEGVHLSHTLMMQIVEQFPNVVPFLIYIKKEDFHRQRFAVRAKYMTTDPAENRYISNFASIRLVQTHLSAGASKFGIPKIDNRNIDRSLETMHMTIFTYLKKLEGSSQNTMYDPQTQKLTFLNTVWKRRKQKQASKLKTLSTIRAMGAESSNSPQNSLQSPQNSLQSPQNSLQSPQNLLQNMPQNSEKNGNSSPQAKLPSGSMKALLEALPRPEMCVMDDVGGTEITVEPSGTMILTKHDPEPAQAAVEETVEEAQPIPPVSSSAENDDVDCDVATSENDPAEITLTDFLETTDSETPTASFLQALRKSMHSGDKPDHPLD